MKTRASRSVIPRMSADQTVNHWSGTRGRTEPGAGGWPGSPPRRGRGRGRRSPRQRAIDRLRHLARGVRPERATTSSRCRSSASTGPWRNSAALDDRAADPDVLHEDRERELIAQAVERPGREDSQRRGAEEPLRPFVGRRLAFAVGLIRASRAACQLRLGLPRPRPVARRCRVGRAPGANSGDRRERQDIAVGRAGGRHRSARIVATIGPCHGPGHRVESGRGSAQGPDESP